MAAAFEILQSQIDIQEEADLTLNNGSSPMMVDEDEEEDQEDDYDDDYDDDENDDDDYNEMKFGFKMNKEEHSNAMKTKMLLKAMTKQYDDEEKRKRKEVADQKKANEKAKNATEDSRDMSAFSEQIKVLHSIQSNVALAAESLRKKEFRLVKI